MFGQGHNRGWEINRSRPRQKYWALATARSACMKSIDQLSRLPFHFDEIGSVVAEREHTEPTKDLNHIYCLQLAAFQSRERERKRQGYRISLILSATLCLTVHPLDSGYALTRIRSSTLIVATSQCPYRLFKLFESHSHAPACVGQGLSISE